MEPHFFQLLDRIRFQAAMSALAREGKNLALISQIQALSEHYKEALLERLQQDVPHLEIKTFFPADADGIVQRFNQVVEKMPITQALDRNSNERHLELWVVHDAAALPSHELRLLLQLLEKFPGSQVRALLVYGGVGALPDNLDEFDKSLMRWIVERPSLDHIKEALAQEQDPDRIASLRALIQRMAPGGSNKEAVTAALNHHATASALPVQRPPTPAPSRLFRWLKVCAAALALMALSIAVALKLHPDALHAVWPAWTPKTKALAESTPPHVDTPALASSPSAQDQGNSPATPSPTSVASPAPSPKPGESESLAQADALITELPEEAVKGERWAWQLNVMQIVVQHGIAPTYAKALDLRTNFPDLSDVHVVPQFVGNESQARFALVSGPFQSKEEADRFIKTKKAPRDSWVRNAAALQERLIAKSTEPKKP
jgi:hypothetical protein